MSPGNGSVTHSVSEPASWSSHCPTVRGPSWRITSSTSLRSRLTPRPILGSLFAAVGSNTRRLGFYGVASWDGWPRTAGLLALGAAIGLLLAAAAHIGKGANPIGLLAALLVSGVGTAGAAHARHEVIGRICDDDSRYRKAATTMLLAPCPTSLPVSPPDSKTLADSSRTGAHSEG